MKKSKTSPSKKTKQSIKRNDQFFDSWSIVHLLTGVAFGWLIDPFAALAIMVLWEPLEIFILSPILARFNVVFGYESLKNSLSDVFFDVVGVAIGAFILIEIIDPPFHLF